MEFTLSCETYIDDLEHKLNMVNDALANSSNRSFGLFTEFEKTNSNFVKFKLRHLFAEEMRVEKSLEEEKTRIINLIEDAKKDQLLFEEFG